MVPSVATARYGLAKQDTFTLQNFAQELQFKDCNPDQSFSWC